MATPSHPAEQTSARAETALTLLTFSVFGAAFGIWQVVLPDIAAALALTPGTLGLALTVGFTASLPVMLVGGRFADRWGTRRTTAIGAAWFGVSIAAVALVQSYLAFTLVVLSFFAASGVYDVAINAAAMRAEDRRGSELMTYVHAAFSGSAAIGAVLTGAALAAGLPFRWLYLVAGLLFLAVVVATVRRPSDARRREDRPPSDAPPVHRRPVLLLLAAVTTCAFLAEGAMENWSAIYLRSALDLSAAAGASGVAVFHGAMLVGRLLASRTVRRFEGPTVLVGSGAFAAVGVTVALATEITVVTLLGFLVVGLSLAAVAPVAFSLAGRLAPESRGGASALIATIGYGGFLVGPALVGVLAEFASLRAALGVIAVAGALIVVLAWRVRASVGSGATGSTG